MPLVDCFGQIPVADPGMYWELVRTHTAQRQAALTICSDCEAFLMQCGSNLSASPAPSLASWWGLRPRAADYRPLPMTGPTVEYFARDGWHPMSLIQINTQSADHDR